MELALHGTPRDAYSKFINPQSDLGKEIQSLHKSIQVMFCPTIKAEVKDHFDLADNFITGLFTSTKSYPPLSGFAFQLSSSIYVFIPEAHLLDYAHAPVIRMIIMLNSKLTQMYWQPVVWELWGRSAAELNVTNEFNLGEWY
jgi:hypothetical protein